MIELQSVHTILSCKLITKTLPTKCYLLSKVHLTIGYQFRLWIPNNFLLLSSIKKDSWYKWAVIQNKLKEKVLLNIPQRIKTILTITLSSMLMNKMNKENKKMLIFVSSLMIQDLLNCKIHKIINKNLQIWIKNHKKNNLLQLNNWITLKLNIW